MALATYIIIVVVIAAAVVVCLQCMSIPGSIVEQGNQDKWEREGEIKTKSGE